MLQNTSDTLGYCECQWLHTHPTSVDPCASAAQVAIFDIYNTFRVGAKHDEAVCPVLQGIALFSAKLATEFKQIFAEFVR